MTWYAIRCEPGRLPVVRQLLRRSGEVCYLPAEIRKHHRRKRRFVMPLMPYLFVKGPERELLALWQQKVKGTRYVKAFVTMDRMGAPHPIADWRIDRLKTAIQDVTAKKLQQQALEAAKHKRGFRPGAKVRHKNGRVGHVVWSHGTRVKWETFLFGRPVIVESSTSMVEAA